MTRRILTATFIGLIIGIYLGPLLIPIPDLFIEYVSGGLLGAFVGSLVGVIWSSIDEEKRKKIMMIKIKRSHFRIILIIYVSMIVIPMLIGSGLDSYDFQYPEENLAKIAILGFIAAIMMFIDLFLLLVSLVGLFLFKSFSRYLFIIANAVSFLIHPFLQFFEKLLIGKHVMNEINDNIVHSPLVVILGTLSSLLTLAIIIISFTRFGSHLFQQKEAETKK